jgi:hypothetical protein
MQMPTQIGLKWFLIFIWKHWVQFMAIDQLGCSILLDLLPLLGTSSKVPINVAKMYILLQATWLHNNQVSLFIKSFHGELVGQI